MTNILKKSALAIVLCIALLFSLAGCNAGEQTPDTSDPPTSTTPDQTTPPDSAVTPPNGETPPEDEAPPDDETPPTEDDKQYFTVSFDTDGGSAVSAQYIEKDAKAAEPSTPVRTGKKFVGWYKEGKTEEYDFDTPVTANITIYARWAEVDSVIVRFDADGGSSVPAQEIAYNSTVTLPSDPVKNGYVFSGWYSDSAKTAEYDFGKPAVTDFTLYAKWTVEPLAVYEVKFETNGGNNIPSQEVISGGKAVLPAPPVRTDYTFEGWYNQSLTEEYDFGNPVTANITLYAKWTDNSALPEYVWKTAQADFTASVLAQYTSSNTTKAPVTEGRFTYAAGVYFEGSDAGLKTEYGNINTRAVAEAIKFTLTGSENAISFSARPAGNSSTVVLKSESGETYTFELAVKEIYTFAIGSSSAFGETAFDNVQNIQLPAGQYSLYDTSGGVRLGNLKLYEYVSE